MIIFIKKCSYSKIFGQDLEQFLAQVKRTYPFALSGHNDFFGFQINPGEVQTKDFSDPKAA